MYSEHVSEWGKLLLACVGSLLPVLSRLCLRCSYLPLVGGIHRATGIILYVSVGAAVVNYYRCDYHLMATAVDEYDIAHYYLGTKYFDELGYTTLYPAIILADSQGQNRLCGLGVKCFRDLQSYKMSSLDLIERQREQIVSAFSPPRWQQFCHDVQYLIARSPNAGWPRILTDRGCNATPTGIWVCGALANHVPIEHVKALCSLDLLLMAAGVLTILWAYGTSVVSLAVLFLFVTFSSRWPRFGEALLRMDWIVAMMIALGLLHRGKSCAAGCLWAYAISVRVFPAVFLLGPVVKVLAAIVSRRMVDRSCVRFMAGVGAGAVILGSIAFLMEGPSAFCGSWNKLWMHQQSEHLSVQRVGFAVALAYRGELKWRDIHAAGRWTAKKVLVDSMKSWRYTGAFAALLVLGLLVPRQSIEGALVPGIAVFFFLTYASYYYFVLRVLLVIVYASDPKKRSSLFGLSSLFVIEVISYVHQVALHTTRYALTAQLSVLLTIHFIVVLAIQLLELGFRNPRRESPSQMKPSMAVHTLGK